MRRVWVGGFVLAMAVVAGNPVAAKADPIVFWEGPTTVVGSFTWCTADECSWYADLLDVSNFLFGGLPFDGTLTEVTLSLDGVVQTGANAFSSTIDVFEQVAPMVLDGDAVASPETPLIFSVATLAFVLRIAGDETPYVFSADLTGPGTVLFYLEALPTASVPEPGTLTLLAVGLAAAMGRRRRNRAWLRGHSSHTWRPEPGAGRLTTASG